LKTLKNTPSRGAAPTRLERRLFYRNRKKSGCRVKTHLALVPMIESNQYSTSFRAVSSTVDFQGSANFRSTSKLRAELNRDIEPINRRLTLLLSPSQPRIDALVFHVIFKIYLDNPFICPASMIQHIKCQNH
jgi:hypothetical protein